MPVLLRRGRARFARRYQCNQGLHPLLAVAANLTTQLRDLGISVTVQGTEPRFKGPAGSLTPDLKAAITAQGAGLVAELTGFQPLDGDIIRHVSRKPKNTIDEIRARLDHPRQMAEAPGAAPVWAQAVRDWTAILAAAMNSGAEGSRGAMRSQGHPRYTGAAST